MIGRKTEAIAVALPRPSVGAGELVWPTLLALATAAAIAPLWASDLLPYQDGPQHVAAVRILADHHTPGLAFDRWFQIDLGRLQYLGFYLPAAAIARLTGADVAVRLMLSLIAVATSAAFWMFLGAFGRDRRLALFAPAVFHGAPLYLGFFNFVESIPLALAVVALTERELHEPARWRAVAVAVCAPVLLWLHPSALAFALAAACLFALTSGRPRRCIVRALSPYLPALALFGAWLVQALASRDGAGAQARAAPRWLGAKEQVLDLLRYGNVLAGNADELYVLALAALFVALVLVGPRRRIERGWRVPLLAALTLAAYLISPYDMGYMGYIHTRALPFFVLLAIASPALSPGRAAGLLLGAVVALQVAYGARLSVAYRDFDREAEVAGLREVLDAAEPGRRLLAVIETTQSRVVQFQAYVHFASYYELLRGGRARYSFAETPWTPIRFRRGKEPVGLPRGWELQPRTLDLSRAVSDEDYVLERGPGPVPAGFGLVKRAGTWSLWAPRAP